MSEHLFGEKWFRAFCDYYHVPREFEGQVKKSLDSEIRRNVGEVLDEIERFYPSTNLHIKIKELRQRFGIVK